MADMQIWKPSSYQPREAAPPAPAQDFLLDRHSELFKAAGDARAAGIPYRMNQQIYGFGGYQGVKDLPSALMTTYNVLRQVPARNPVVAAIIRHRQNQGGNYHRLPRFEGDTGFRVGYRSKEKKPNAAAKKKMREIEDILLYGGIKTPHPRTGQVAVWDAEGARKAKGIARAARALIGDSLTIDAAAIRIQPGMNATKYPVAYWDTQDAALVRYAIPEEQGANAVAGTWTGIMSTYRPEIREGKQIAYVTIGREGMGIMGEYAWNEMGYLVRNYRTDEWVLDYGWSEIEQLISVITGLLYGIAFNTEYFDSNHVPPGILALPGDYSDPVLNDFRKQLRTMCGGPGQFWAMPIMAKGINGGTVDYVPLRQESSEGMFWEKWILFCSNVACALFGMDSSEINMTNFGASSNAIGNQNPEDKVDRAQENGLEPLLAAFAAFWNEEIVQKLEPDFIFEYTGLSEPDEAMQEQKSTFRAEVLGSTPNMERALLDKRPVIDPLDRPLWDEISDTVKTRMGDDYDQDEIEEMILKVYKAKGGTLAQWPDAPVSCPGALGIWQIEHNIQAPPAMEAGSPGGDPNDPTQQGGQPGTTGQPGERDFPQPQPAQALAPAPSAHDKTGPDTHTQDVGSMLLRRPQAGQPQAAAPTKQTGNIGKSLEPNIIEVIVRRPPDGR